MTIHPTKCCALCQMSASNDDSLLDLRSIISFKQDEALREWTPAQEGGQRSVFCIVAPGEDTLRRNLITLGFEKVHTFRRRRGYAAGMLEMWVMAW